MLANLVNNALSKGTTVTKKQSNAHKQKNLNSQSIDFGQNTKAVISTGNSRSIQRNMKTSNSGLISNTISGPARKLDNISKKDMMASTTLLANQNQVFNKLEFKNNGQRNNNDIIGEQIITTVKQNTVIKATDIPFKKDEDRTMAPE